MYRYPGPAPFKEGMQDLYHGREEDVENLYNSLLINNCTVIVGKSGIGKSSLINAGLIPRIENNINNISDDQRHFIIIRVRVGSYEKTQKETLLQRFNQAVFAAYNKPVTNSFLSFLSDDLKQSVGFVLKQWQYDAFLQKKKIIFLFIFDQLEELFTYPMDQFEELEKEVKELQSPHIPDVIRYQIESLPDRRRWISTAEAEILTIPVPVKFLFAIRSDKLSLLIRLKDALPNVLGNLYELRPMNEEQAKKAIGEPSSKAGDFATAPFNFDDEAIDYIIDYLENLPGNDLDNNLETSKIDPITLQIICQYVEQKIAPFDEDRIIKKYEIKDPDLIFTDYYEDTLQSLNLKPEDLRQAKEMIENKLIYEPEKTRRQLFLEECGIDITLMNTLVDSRLLRQINSIGRKPYYELSHDWLVPYVLHAKKNRIEAEQQNKDERVQTLMNNERISIVYSYDGFKSLKEKADEFFASKNYNDALIKYNDAIKVKESLSQPLLQTEDVDLFYAIGECFFRLNRFEESLTDLEYVLKIQPDHKLANFYTAYDYHMLGRLEQSIVQYKKLLVIDPGYINAWFNSGLIYNALKDNTKAKECFRKVIELDVNDPDAWYNLGVISNNISGFEEAITNLSAAIKLKSDYINAYIELAYAYSSQTPPNFNSAIECYDNILKYDSSNAKAYRSKAAILNELGKTDEAEICLLKATSFDGNDFTAPYKLGIMASNAGHYSEAIKFFEKVLQLNPDYKDALIEKAFAHMQLNEYKEALNYYNQLLKLYPEDAQTYYGLGIIYDNLDNKDLSIQNFLEAIKRNEKNDLYYFELGRTYHKYDQRENAEQCFLKQISLNPSSVNVAKSYNYIGYYALENQKFDEALNYYKSAVMHAPDNPDYLYNLGLTYYKLNQNELALQYFQKAVEKNPEDSDAYFYIGDLLEKQNNLPEAINAYQRVLAIKPGLATVIDKLKLLEQAAVSK